MAVKKGPLQSKNIAPNVDGTIPMRTVDVGNNIQICVQRRKAEKEAQKKLTS